MKNISDAQFKKNMDSIDFISEAAKLRKLKASHAIDLEELNIPLKTANEYVEVITDWLESLNFSKDRIEAIECRRRDGFIPHSYNNGGLEGIAYLSQTCLPNGSTGFDNVDTVLERGEKYDLESFLEFKKLKELDYDNESLLNEYDEYRRESDDTIQFQARVMFTSETTANVDFYISASDSPYHRSSDDKLEIEIKFKTPNGLKKQLAKLSKSPFVKCIAQNVREAY